MFKVKFYFMPHGHSILDIVIYRRYDCTVHECKRSHKCPYAKLYTSKSYFKFLKEMFCIGIYEMPYTIDLSGTNVCPHHFKRARRCWNCDYSYNADECWCAERAKAIQSKKKVLDPVYDSFYPSVSICHFFKPVSWFNDYDKNVKI